MVSFVGWSVRGLVGDTGQGKQGDGLRSRRVPPPFISRELVNTDSAGLINAFVHTVSHKSLRSRLLHAPLEVNPQQRMIAKCMTVLTPTVTEGWGGSGGDGPEWRISILPPPTFPPDNQRAVFLDESARQKHNTNNPPETARRHPNRGPP